MKRGVKLGRPTKSLQEMADNASKRRSKMADDFAMVMYKSMKPMRNSGLTYQEIANAYNKLGLETQRGKEWTPAGVRNVLQRVEAIEAQAA